VTSSGARWPEDERAAPAASPVRAVVKTSAVLVSAGPSRPAGGLGAVAARVTARRRKAFPIKAKAEIHKV
jgi:hypothetical protein